MVVIFASLSWLILIQRQRERDQDRDKIGFYNITWKFSHCNLSCTCTHTFALYRLSFLYGYFTQPGSGSSPHTISTKGNNIFILEIFWRTSVLFVRPLIPLFWTCADVCHGFQSQGGFLACVLPRLHAMDSLDSSIVRHQLTSWQPSLFDPQTYICAYKQHSVRCNPLSHSGSAQGTLSLPKSV